MLEIAKKTPERDMVKFLQKVLASKTLYNSNVSYAGARILSALLSNFNTYTEYANDAKIMMNFLITNSLKSSKTLSDFIVSVCISNLLLIPSIPNYFLEHDGYVVIMNLFDKNSKDLQVMYYTFLSVWILSYEEKFIRYIADPKVS